MAKRASGAPDAKAAAKPRARAAHDLGGGAMWETTLKATIHRERLFYVIAAWISLAMAMLGFRHFYFGGGKGFGGNPLTHQIVPIILVHAFAMSSWAVLFLAQSILVLRGSLRRHRAWGWVGTGLAGAVIVLGATMGILSAHYNPQAYMMFSGPKFFLAEMLTEIALFGVLVAVAVACRTKPKIHRPFMLTATIVIMSGALARAPLVDFLAATAPLYAYGPVLAFGLLLYLLKLAVTRRNDHWFALALGTVGLVFLASLPLGHSAAWQSIWGNFIA